MVNKKLIFENGKSFLGTGFGADVNTVKEAVFNTSMVGYQEIFSDPSYFGQIVCMTYPLIGNYGITDEDYETPRPFLGGFIVREYNNSPSNYKCTKTLEEDLKEYNIPGISFVDTRQITKMIRDEGSIRVLLTSSDTTLDEGLSILKKSKKITNQTRNVSCKKKWRSCTANFKYTVVVLDCGVKLSVIKSLVKRKCNVIVVPYNTSSEEILKLNPNGLLISNGPGDPRDNLKVIEVIKNLQGKISIFGICLGHQLIALANGAEIYKMKFGHHGGNHPVKEISTDKIEITSQNHSYAVKKESLKNTKIFLTHVNLLDDAVEGIEIKNENVFSVQYHPESSPGPQDSSYLFDRFIGKL
ncbi:MAG: glutamine-hydrolyzing carbamoyl-phosphate synthase small subunit [Oscillospiraceae bacterium]|jgi:carbamoyl-phosphate synthase small subunit|nr:glutamine-hydrolyzing carbamoyl-phosphate synthase small subunit [Oscillospiraceae bacterium]